MTRGLIYYNRGTKCLIRMLTSMWSLRKAGYQGPVAVLHDDDLPDWVGSAARDICKNYPIQFVRIPDDEFEKAPNPLCQKSRLWRFTPFDTTLFIDTDTVVQKDPSPLFDEIEKTGFAVTVFSNWKTNEGKIIRSRIEAWRHIVGDEITDRALAFGTATNTGVFGWTKGHPLLEPWAKLTRAGQRDGGPMGRTLDESACQVLGATYGPITLIDEKWNWSVKFGVAPIEDAGIIHYHGGKHTIAHDDPSNEKWNMAEKCDRWRVNYWQMRHHIAADQYEDPIYGTYGDKGTAREIDRAVRKDLTICIAADIKYAAKLTRHFKLWMETPGLCEQRYLLFTIGANDTEPQYDELTRYANVEPVRYDPPCDMPARWAAFHAFVFGAAEHVTTPYWMKLDGDASPKGRFVWPEYQRNIITAPKWHYSKVKKDPDAKQHWLTTLDQWWSGIQQIPEELRLQPLFPNIEPDQRRVKHRRLRSYVWIEKTEHTRRLAELCGDRLPVPSHDTTAWYVGHRLGVRMKAHPFTEFITA